MSHRCTAPLSRPEDRRRGDGEALRPWHALPPCVRSEAFAEDLPDSASLQAAPARRASAALAPLVALALAVGPCWPGR
jgi:hypothetical protein